MGISAVFGGLGRLRTFSKCWAQTSEISSGAVTVFPFPSFTGSFRLRRFPMISLVIL